MVYRTLSGPPLFYQVHFKTSYVMVYQQEPISPTRQGWHFKTSYVMVYPLHAAALNAPQQFQNIICYGLSSSMPKRSPCRFYFKTSYVMVYLSGTSSSKMSDKFQNIICYGLSMENDTKKRHVILFQNIICYGLSEKSPRESSDPY